MLNLRLDFKTPAVLKEFSDVLGEMGRQRLISVERSKKKSLNWEKKKGEVGGAKWDEIMWQFIMQMSRVSDS